MTDRGAMIVILGPTASGKTRLAVEVALRLDGEIISADSRQVYRGMTLGTGKDLAEYRREGRVAPYHLIDILEPGVEFSVFDFQRLFLRAYEDIRGRGKWPVLCGGTGLYIDAVLSGYRLIETPRNERLREELAPLDLPGLVARLQQIRPIHNRKDMLDRERLTRAIEIEEYARLCSVAPLARIPARVYGVRWDRAVLRRRIAERLKARLDAGLAEEVRELLAGGVSAEQLAAYGLEYRHVTHYVLGAVSRADMEQELCTAIRQFAKRQETWFRRMERHGTPITWLPGNAAPERNAQRILEECMA